MNWIDGAIVVLVIWFTFSAFHAGFIRETVTIVGAVIGVVLAGLFYRELADSGLWFIDNATLARIVAFSVIFGGSALVGQLVALVLKPTVHVFQLGIFDQLIGAAFGLVKAIVFIEIFLIVFVTYPKWGLDQDIEDSAFGSLLVESTPFMTKLLPDEFDSAIDQFDRTF